LILGASAIVLACGKGERFRAALSRDPCRTLARDGRSEGVGSRGVQLNSTRPPAASITGLGMGLAPQVGQEETFDTFSLSGEGDIRSCLVKDARHHDFTPSLTVPKCFSVGKDVACVRLCALVDN
jgi:hypothetical protein